MAKAKTVPGYEVAVTGQYIATNEHGVKTKKFYKKESFTLPEISAYKNGMKSEIYTVENPDPLGEPIKKKREVPNIIRENTSRGNVALHMIRRFYIEDRLKEKYEDYVAVKTCEVFSKEKIDIPVNEAGDIESKPIKDMTLSQLKQYVDLMNLQVILSDYYDLGDKKMAVEHALQKKRAADAKLGQSQLSKEEELLREPESPLFQ